MNLPLSHCDALGCRELVSPDLLMCEKHAALVSAETARLLANARPGTRGREHAEMMARMEVAGAEGRNPAITAHDLASDIYFPDLEALSPDASQGEQQPTPTPGAVEPGSQQLPSAGL